jgi:hypothetical protein
MTTSSERIANARLNADMALSQARLLRFELKQSPGKPHARGRGWLNEEQVALLGLVIAGARESAEAERMIESRVDRLISEYADDPRQDGLSTSDARRQVRDGIELCVREQHRKEARDPYGYMRARHYKLASQGFKPSLSDS